MNFTIILFHFYHFILLYYYRQEEVFLYLDIVGDLNRIDILDLLRKALFGKDLNEYTADSDKTYQEFLKVYHDRKQGQGGRKNISTGLRNLGLRSPGLRNRGLRSPGLNLGNEYNTYFWDI